MSHCETVAGYERDVSRASRLIGARLCHLGTDDSFSSSPCEVYSYAVLCNARGFVLVRNGPSSNLEPGRDDVFD